jgi:glutathione S-transferase
MLTLYQFPISHFCEKARWALDYKGLAYRQENLLPGLHVKTTKAMARRSSVPVLRDGETVVQGSTAIIDWLDEHYRERPLTPADPDLAADAREWENLVDREFGPHVRRFAYHTLLEHPDVVKPFFRQGGKWWWRPFLAVTYPKLSRVMRKLMAIDEPGAEESRQRIEATLATVSERLGERGYLVGDQFSRADLAAAALMAPMVMPPEYGLNWPARMPEPLQGWADAHDGQLDWVRRLYRDHR